MPSIRNLKLHCPGLRSAGLAVFAALMLILSFPDFELSWLAWPAFIPLLIALEPGERPLTSSFLAGWLFGTAFFFGTCWWLTFAPITYAQFPVIPTYLLLLAATAASGVFSGLFALTYAFVRKQNGVGAILSAPFLWAAFEFCRYWITGNNWNAVGYSQAFEPLLIQNASIGGVYLTGFVIVLASSLAVFFAKFLRRQDGEGKGKRGLPAAVLLAAAGTASVVIPALEEPGAGTEPVARLVAVQPNVPMAGLNFEVWRKLRSRQIELAGRGIGRYDGRQLETVVVLPESPMNYQYELDPEFRKFINEFASVNGVSVLFNAAEPDRAREGGFFNSAVMVNEGGTKEEQYDKIHLLPFGEFVPLPEFAQELIPPMVGRFSHGSEYDLFDIGGARAGVMICFESHFPSLSGEYARKGADLIIEMTNDGYLGDTPVLRQHLANAVFRAAETRRPLFRVTNVGVTARIDEFGRVHDEAGTYREDVRVWDVYRSAGTLTPYARAGDWFAGLCAFLAAVFLAVAFKKSYVRR